MWLHDISVIQMESGMWGALIEPRLRTTAFTGATNSRPSSILHSIASHSVLFIQN